MLEESKKILKSVSIEQIKDILKRNVASEYDKMIISSDTEIKRADYYYSVLNYKIAKRKMYKISFPLFEEIKDDFSVFEGGVERFGEKSIVEYEGFINEFSKVRRAEVNEIPSIKVGDAFDYPFDLENSDISKTQRKYFLPRLTHQEECAKCDGTRYITCIDKECGGKHVWRCNNCIGKGEVTCSKCKGKGYNECSSCSGTGERIIKENRNNKIYEKKVKCSNCKGKGDMPCSKCDSSGMVRCKTCKGVGEISCEHCYTEPKKGKIDCPVCFATGSFGNFVFVETIIEDLSSSKLVRKGSELELKRDNILAHVKEELEFVCAYKNINGEVTDSTDEISQQLIQAFEYELEISKNDFPIVLKEDIIYQVIPVVEISYKHILTSETHSLALINFWDSNPGILFHSNAEKLNISVKSISKSVGGLFSKVFKTKAHFEKEDRKTEIMLMIYLAKSDGKIEEEEKEYLSDQISYLTEFRNSEKKELFDLMNAEELPELTSSDVKFSDPEKGKEIIEKLVQLAHADGEFEEAEKQLIDKIKNLLDE